jgi:hypothetical protein
VPIEGWIKQCKAKNDALTALSKAAEVCFEAHAMMKTGAEDDPLGAINRAMTLLTTAATLIRTHEEKPDADSW